MFEIIVDELIKHVESPIIFQQPYVTNLILSRSLERLAESLTQY